MRLIALMDQSGKKVFNLFFRKIFYVASKFISSKQPINTKLVSNDRSMVAVYRVSCNEGTSAYLQLTSSLYSLRSLKNLDTCIRSIDRRIGAEIGVNKAMHTFSASEPAASNVPGTS